MKRQLCALLSLLIVGAAFASCGAPAKDPADALAALKENEYTAAKDEIFVPLALKALNVDGVKTVISGTKITEEKTEHVTVIYFDDKDAANEAWENVEKYAEDNKKDESDWVVKKSGAMIYFGTSAGIKAAK